MCCYVSPMLVHEDLQLNPYPYPMVNGYHKLSTCTFDVCLGNDQKSDPDDFEVKPCLRSLAALRHAKWFQVCIFLSVLVFFSPFFSSPFPPSFPLLDVFLLLLLFIYFNVLIMHYRVSHSESEAQMYVY